MFLDFFNLILIIINLILGCVCEFYIFLMCISYCLVVSLVCNSEFLMFV